MSDTLVVGIIGLAGAVVGALAAFLGVVYQQRQQARLADRERRAALSQGAVDSLLIDLEALRDHAWKRPADGDVAPGWGEWVEEMGRILARIRLSIFRLSDRDLRETLRAACLFGFGNEDLLQEAIGLRAGRILMVAMCGEAQECLGYYLRREPIPATRFLSQARREYEVVTRQPAPGRGD
ncbi:hypothetical protein [Streptomyces pseudogriseolus]|uniref:hypothetical protein n=1 Tax=Streptomyces pseudogriseolus TaxID=36817 RepID=UPI003FA321A8